MAEYVAAPAPRREITKIKFETKVKRRITNDNKTADEFPERHVFVNSKKHNFRQVKAVKF